MDKMREKIECFLTDQHNMGEKLPPAVMRLLTDIISDIDQAARQPQERGEAVAAYEADKAAFDSWLGRNYLDDEGGRLALRMSNPTELMFYAWRARAAHPTPDAGRVAELEAELADMQESFDEIHEIAIDYVDRLNALEAQLAEARTELEKETAQSKHLAEAMSRKIQELIAAENQCAYYKGQYTRTEQVRKEACEANAKAQAKTLWLEGELAASREREGRMREALQNLLRETHEPSCYHVHHAKRDQHEYIEACPVIQRHRTAVGRAVAALAAKKGEE